MTKELISKYDNDTGAGGVTKHMKKKCKPFHTSSNLGLSRYRNKYGLYQTHLKSRSNKKESILLQDVFPM